MIAIAASTAIWTTVLAVSGGLLALVALMVWAARQILYVCAPDEILIFSGRDRRTEDGRTVGFRVVSAGRAICVPILERVDRMDMRLLSVPMTVEGAYSEGGIPLTVQALANVKISGNPERQANAIERFLGRDRAEIGQVVKETLEGHLRGVVATMTPEEVNEDRLKFAARLEEEAQEDLEKLGIQLDTLKIQHVSDDRNYLDSIGRKRIAEIIRAAEVAESDAMRSAEEAEAASTGRARVAESQAKANIAKATNAMRRYVAELDARARSVEALAEPAAAEARANAEKELQEVRSDLESLRLAAEVTIPASVERQVAELLAQGEAARISEKGKAMASSVEAIAGAWQGAGDRAMDIYVLQNLDRLFGAIARAAAGVTVQEAALIDGGDGEAIPTYAATHPATMRALMGEVARTLGVDINRVLTGRASG